MQVSVETLSNLERMMTVLVPAERIENEVEQRLLKLAKSAKVAGFRPGKKLPMSVVKSHFSKRVRGEVATELLQSTLYEGLKQKELIPVDTPEVEPSPLEEGKDFQYTAKFEVFPEFTINEIGEIELELLHAEVNDSDVDELTQKLRDNHKTWHEVSRPAENQDKVIVDFKGFIEDKAFEGGEAKDCEIILGSGSMIPGFEDGIIGKDIAQEFELKVSFPQDYGREALAGKEAVFQLKLKKVMQGELPELNDAFAERFNLKGAGLEGLQKELRSSMERELERRLKTLNHEKIFAALLKANEFDVPLALVNREIENLQHAMYHRLFGPEHHDHEKIPDFPRALFEEQALNRAKLGLLFSKYIDLHKIEASKEKIEAHIELLAEAYEEPEQVKEHYLKDKKKFSEIEALVLEDLVAEKICEVAKVKNKEVTYNDVMQEKARQGE